MKALGFFAHLSTVLLILISGWILYMQPDFELIDYPLMITVMTMFIFLFLQGLLALLMRGQQIANSLLDIIMSVVALVAMIFLVVFSDKMEVPLWWTLYFMFALPVLYDFLINNGMLLKLLGLSNAITSER